MTQYVAFLRGINLGKRTIKMEELRKSFESLGFTQVKTVLASGNVLFESVEKDPYKLAGMIEEKLQDRFGFAVGTIVWPIEKIKQLIDANPFKNIRITPDMRLYVTFLTGEPEGKIKIPYASAEGDFKILTIINNAVCSVLTISPTRKTVDLMAILEKEYGKKVTTRNWNTIQKLLPIN
jgi:uncharacterized protein (DUF1697 family)